jgi:hypothetical protein
MCKKINFKVIAFQHILRAPNVTLNDLQITLLVKLVKIMFIQNLFL